MSEIAELDPAGLRRFGLTFSAIIAGLFGLVVPMVLGLSFALWPWIVAAVFTTWALIAPATMRPAYRIWMRFGLIMNAIMSRIILGVVFYLIVFPIGCIRRAFGYDSMARTTDPETPTYRVISTKRPPSQMEKPF